MCYDAAAMPPAAPQPAAAAHGEDLTLTAADGAESLAYHAHAADPAPAQVIIYPDAGGIGPFYRELAMRFAEQGIDALVLDQYGRTAGTGPRDSFDWAANYHAFQLPPFWADVRAALDYLRGSNPDRPTFTLGFCMGGSLSFVSGAQDFGLAGVIGFYGGLSRQFNGADRPVLEQAAGIHTPVLGLFGGADSSIPISQVQHFEKTLEANGVPHDIVVYAEAPHSFFDRNQANFAAASDDAWLQVLRFIKSKSLQAAAA